MEAVGDHVEEFSHIVETFANHSPTDLVSSRKFYSYSYSNVMSMC